MIHIQEAQIDDVGVVLDLAMQMHAESRYSFANFSKNKMMNLIISGIENLDGLVLKAVLEGPDPVVVGGFIGLCTPHWVLESKMALDLGVFVLPDYRSSSAASLLLWKYVGWARSRDVPDQLITLGTSTGVMPERVRKLYRKLGFVEIGGNFAYRG